MVHLATLIEDFSHIKIQMLQNDWMSAYVSQPLKEWIYVLDLNSEKETKFNKTREIWGFMLEVLMKILHYFIPHLFVWRILKKIHLSSSYILTYLMNTHYVLYITSVWELWVYIYFIFSQHIHVSPCQTTCITTYTLHTY